MTFDALDFLAGLYAPVASPVYDPDADEAGSVELPTAVVRVVDAERLDLRRELAGIIREARRDGDPHRAADARELFAERAGIMQFDGGMSRGDAERCALADVLPRLRRVNVAADNRPDPLAGLVNEGWTPMGWRNRLMQLADVCQAVRPDLAAEHRANAAKITKTIEGNDHAT